MIVVPLGIFCFVLMLLCLIGLIIAGVHLVRTGRLQPDRGARVDRMRLLTMATITFGLAAARTQFLSTSRPFLIISILLVLCGIVVLALLTRLIRAYRSEQAPPADSTLPDVATLQSRISPLSMERTNDDSRRKSGKP